MLDVATYVRIFDPKPADELVAKRTTAIAAMKVKIEEAGELEDMFAFENDLAEGVVNGCLPQALIDLIEPAIKAESQAFVHEESKLEAIVCALLAAEQVFGDAEPANEWYTVPAVHAIANWLAMSAIAPRKEPKLEELCNAVRQAAHESVDAAAAKARQRYSIKGLKVTWPQAGEGVAFAKEVTDKVNSQIHMFVQNAELDREEIDILWWVLNDWSDILQLKFSSAPMEQAAIAAAWELGEMLCCPPVDAHKHMIFRHINEDKEISLKTLQDALAPARAKITLSEEKIGRAKRYPRIFPLTLAVVGDPTHGWSDETTKLLSEWSVRALLEAAVLELTADPE